MPIASSLNEKLGPLPVWAWGGIAGVVILGGEYIYKRAHPKAAVPASDSALGVTGSTAPASSPTVTPDGSFLASGSYVPPSGGAYMPPETSIASPPAITDNDEWVRVSTGLVAAGNPQFSMIQIDEALKAYIDGRPVTALQAAIIELALRAAGSPPYTVPPIQVTPIATPPVQVAPPAAQPVTAPASRQLPPAAAPWSWLPSFLQGVRFVKGSGPAVYDVTAQGLEWVPSEQALARMKAGIPVEQQTVLVIPNTALAPLPRVGTRPSPDAAGDPTLAW